MVEDGTDQRTDQTIPGNIETGRGTESVRSRENSPLMERNEKRTFRWKSSDREAEKMDSSLPFGRYENEWTLGEEIRKKN